MAKEEKIENKCNCENCDCKSLNIISGLKFGFGMFLSFLAGSAILIIIAIAFYYLSELI